MYERVILASSSPQRFKILKEEFNFSDIHAVPSSFSENLPHEAYAPFEYPIATSTQKAFDVYKKEVNKELSPDILIAADTIIELNGKILEKPKNVENHVLMLKQLRDSDKPHKVYTGVTVIVPFEKPVLPGYALDTALGISEVTFKKTISDEEIFKYVASKEGSDAAGGYKIQGKGGEFVECVKGDRFNVIGLPVEETKKLIEKVMAEAQEENSD